MAIRVRERGWSSLRPFPWFAWIVFLAIVIALGYALLSVMVTVVQHIPALSQ